MSGRKIKLLKTLCQQKEYKPAAYFGKLLSVSTKTVYSDLKELKIVCKKFSIEIETMPRKGIFLAGAEADKKKCAGFVSKEINSDIFSPAVRRFLIMRQILLDKDKPSLKNMSEEFWVSKTSIYKDLDVVIKFLVTYGIEILITSDGIETIGLEAERQKAFKAAFFSGLLNIGEMSFANKLKLVIDQHILTAAGSVLGEEYEDIPEYYMQSLFVVLAVQLQRLQYGFHIEKKEMFLFDNMRYMETYVMANEIVEAMKKKLGIVFADGDVEFLCQQLVAHKIGSYVKNTAEEYTDIIKNLIARMEKIEKVDLSNDTRLYNALKYHLPAMILRLRKGIEIKNPILEMIKEEYPKSFSIVWYALSVIESRYNVSLNDDEVSFILVYFQVALDNIQKPHNIVVICPYGANSSQFILSKARRILPEKNHFEVSSLKKLYASSLENVDLIISTVPIPDVTVPVIEVSPLMNDSDCANTMKIYSEYILKKSKTEARTGSIDELKFSQVPRYIERSLIYLNKEFDSKTECLNYLIGRLEDKKYVKENFRESIFNREEMGVTSLESGAALPHADPVTIIRSSISVLTLKRPIVWAGIEVLMVVMVSFAEKDILWFRDVINETYQLVGNSEYVKAISEIKNKDKIMELLCRTE